ncbi:2-amino-4-hydroxy-6-hydroxymethyldihydropteridine pyrophosphokinase [Thermodesulfovibrio sp. N1]|uniref:2-amino-4-hydroxy-6- hydroxymethyldihydropteridine diphosphokinase n=1 Tax=Thermodesulfovibrio sp. N1 TaxID=1871110 RepID=UPI00083B2465|nr:2-amino-4-hydroxy-6-hydroxymethyldihydropteridine diphosphokinase [Thermodesulfovibrio sp. N1]ODA43305.1 2-amino-4-hydroxy-6-hydroxymethyldihydropteridine pyrophosphokinase [Thermodesulfovibrio sp. N1]
MHKVYLLLGSNLGDRNKNIELAISELKDCGVIISKMSSLYNTKPWGYTEQPDFLNQAIECLTILEPLKLLREIKKIEKNLGRTDTIKYGPRIIDIDIIFYNDLILKSKELIIPHPLMHERYFVLKPLSEIAPDFVHPEIGLTVQKLLEKL